MSIYCDFTHSKHRYCEDTTVDTAHIIYFPFCLDPQQILNNHRQRPISTLSSLQVCPRSCLLSSAQSARDFLHNLHPPNPRTWETCLQEKQYLVCGNQITLRSCVLCKHVKAMFDDSQNGDYNTRSKVASPF